MASNNAQLIDQLAQQCGIGSSFYDYCGEHHTITTRTKTALLEAMGMKLDAQASSSNREAAVIEPAYVLLANAPAHVPVNAAMLASDARVDWELQLENGEIRNGFISAELLQTPSARLALPDHLPAGYHSLRLHSGKQQGAARIIVTPSACYAPSLFTHARVWGIAVQLYTLRSQRNWGIGDFTDLCELIELAAPLGCSIIGVNPLHALMPANPAHISPYSPSSRQFLNVLYVAVEEVPELQASAAARARIQQKDFQAELQQLRAAERVDYVRVARLKLEVLRLLYDAFESLPTTHERRRELDTYVQQRGEPLRLHALYDTLDAHFREQSKDYWGWPSWPEDYRDPRSQTVQSFSRAHAKSVGFHTYLQWLADTQLSQAQRHAREHGMTLGLYGDVAVGVNPAGSETWANQALYRQQASIGAPPDALALMGQDWGIPPQDPTELRAQGFAPYAQMLANNMRHTAALRLDHVMALFRLWWVPRGLASKDGAYVHYPLDALMAILALESERNRCFVIGEDLGTVPDEVREAMERFDVYHYRVLLFEKQRDGSFKPPELYTAHSLATVTTHDLPTLKGWWESADIELRDRLKLFPTEKSKEASRAARTSDREQLMHALVAQKLWRWRAGDALPAYSAALSRAIHAYLGLSQANVALIQLEDLIGMTDAVNVPGTSDEHANWQRKMSLDTREIFARTDVLDILEGMRAAREGLNPNA